MSLVKQELLTRPEHMSLPPVSSECSCYPIFSFLCNFVYILVCPFVLFLLPIVLSVLRFTDSEYPFDISKLFSRKNKGLLLFLMSSDPKSG